MIRLTPTKLLAKVLKPSLSSVLSDFPRTIHKLEAIKTHNTETCHGPEAKP